MRIIFGLLLAITVFSLSATTTNGQSISDIKTIMRDGIPVGEEQISSWLSEGKTLAISFWSMACSACIRRLPLDNELAKKYKDEGLMLIWINDRDKPESIPSKIWENYPDMTMLFDTSGQTRVAFGKTPWGPVFFFNEDNGFVWHCNPYEMCDEAIQWILRTREGKPREKRTWQRKSTDYAIMIETTVQMATPKKAISSPNGNIGIAFTNVAAPDFIHYMAKIAYGYEYEVRLINEPECLNDYNIETNIVSKETCTKECKHAFDELCHSFNLHDAVTVDDDSKVITIDLKDYVEVVQR